MECLEAGRAVLVVLNQEKFAIVDSSDRERVDRHIWVFDHGYASKVFRRDGEKPVKVYLHRFVACSNDGFDTDHKNLFKLDNRSANLRVCNRTQNFANKPKSPSNKSGYKGVYYSSKIKRYIATMSIGGKTKYIGCFLTAKLASEAYAREAVSAHGEFARY